MELNNFLQRLTGAAAMSPQMIENRRARSPLLNPLPQEGEETNESLREFHISDAPETIAFNDTVGLIESLYDFTPTAFVNGNLRSEAGTNSGSCKIFSFAQLHGLSQQQTLNCFGAYYRDDVLKHPQGTDHQNIRNFMVTGWAGISFEGCALRAK
ncbi:MAG: HopJ type III effector protein [Gallionella sp.]|nr:HopJ type III effector protein [Gallionella sp.]